MYFGIALMSGCLHKQKIITFFIFFLIILPLTPHHLSTKTVNPHNYIEYSSDHLVNYSCDELNNILHLTYPFQSPNISIIRVGNDSFSSIHINNLKRTQSIHYPQLPYKKIQVLLPPNTKFENLSYTMKTQHLSLDYPLIISKEPDQSSEQDSFNTGYVLNKTNDANENLYPENNVQVIGEGKKQGYSLLLLKIYPIQVSLRKNSNEIIFSSSLSITIKYDRTEVKESLLRESLKDKESIIKGVENPSLVQSYDSHHVIRKVDENSTANYKYLVITSSSLEKFFEPLISYKNQFLSAGSINLSYIKSHFSGIDLQEKIRNCIKYAYLNWHTEYVLLGGDVDVIPYRGLWGYAIDHTGEILQDNNIPGDVYYSALDGTWDNDGDEIYGEDAANSTGEEADFFSEVSLGRAPVENEAEIGTFINKVITYETSEKPLKVLLHQSGLNSRNIPDSTVIPEHCAGWVPSNYEIEKLYQVNEVITPAMWMESFADDNLIVQHTGNGEADRYYLTWPTHTFSTFESLSLLENNFYPIHTSVTCNSGSFEKENDCLAETLLLNPYGGASACLFNSRRGFTSNNDAHKYSGEIIEQQFRYIFAEDIPHIGLVHQLAKEYFSVDAIKDPAYRWCYYTLNLLGDPEMPIFETRSSFLNPSIYYVDDDYNESTVDWQVTCFDSVQDAIDAASDWDVIQVKNGIYNERIVIGKTIELIGEDKYNTILDEQTIQITGDRIKISGFTIRGQIKSSDHNRFILLNSNYVTISDCIIKNSVNGIYVSDARNIFIINNEFKDTLKGIVTAVKTGDVYITQNKFSLDEPDSYGVYSTARGKLILENNTFISNRNFYNFTCGMYSESDTEFFSNDVLDCSIGIWLNDGNHLVTNNQIGNNAHVGLYVSSSSIVISNNSVHDNGNYFLKSYSHPFEPGGLIINGTINEFCEVTNNFFENNKGYGVFVKGLLSFNNKVFSNDFIGNSRSAGFRNSRVSWNNNFWEIQRSLPKIIFGRYQFERFLFFPMFQIDVNPAQSRITMI